MSEQVESTEQERLERLRGVLSGQRAHERVGRALALGQGAYGNVLLGAMLHGADRLRDGQRPTDLEQILLDAAGTQLSVSELRAWGGVYREVVTAQGGRVAALPERITRLPVEQGYTMTDLRQDLPGLKAEALACSNVQIVSPALVAEGEPEDPAFVNGMRETGLAVTAFGDATRTFAAIASGTAGAAVGQDPQAPVGSEESPEGFSAATTFRVKLEMDGDGQVLRPPGGRGSGRRQRRDLLDRRHRRR